VIGRALLVIGLAASCGLPKPASAQALSPGDVLDSVERSMPLLERVRRDVVVAQGALREARGGFDLTLNSSSKTVRGFYDNDRVSAILEQPLAPFGLTTYGGYRTGRGVFAPYDGRAQTLSQGELTAGFELPLMRHRAIDARRADREIADLGTILADRSLDKARLSFFKDALKEYWDWAAAGRERAIAEALLNLAETRDQQLADSVALGQIAPVERTDNRRAILQRRSALVTAERRLQMKAIDLSLFYRLPSGEPVRPAPQLLPTLSRPPETPPPLDEEAVVSLALANRPELQSLRLKRSQQEVQVRLAENATLPVFGFFAEGSHDYGTGARTRVGSAVETGFTFSFPLQNRQASGKRLQARAKVSGLTEELRWAEDQVRAEVQDALSALRAVEAALAVIVDEVSVTQELERLERDRFTLGDSTQFLVNLRELATAEASLREARALADYQKALVALEAATGQLLHRVRKP